jgi:hypothetical protein
MGNLIGIMYTTLSSLAVVGTVLLLFVWIKVLSKKTISEKGSALMNAVAFTFIVTIILGLTALVFVAIISTKSI